jgi:hypothetical protein
MGVYLLPDGTEVVAVPGADGCHLYVHDVWRRYTSAPGDYIVYRSGLIRHKGQLTGWHARELRDTGRTVN